MNEHDFNVDAADHDALITFARDELGLGFHPSLGEDKLRERIKTKIAELAPPPPKPRAAVVQEVVPLKDLPRDQTAVISIAEGDERAVNPVPVIVNGRRFDIRRGHRVRVPLYVVEVLRNAVETRHFRSDPDDLDSPMVARGVPSYPYQIHHDDEPAENDPAARIA